MRINAVTTSNPNFEARVRIDKSKLKKIAAPAAFATVSTVSALAQTDYDYGALQRTAFNTKDNCQFSANCYSENKPEWAGSTLESLIPQVAGADTPSIDNLANGTLAMTNVSSMVQACGFSGIAGLSDNLRNIKWELKQKERKLPS